MMLNRARSPPPSSPYPKREGVRLDNKDSVVPYGVEAVVVW